MKKILITGKNSYIGTKFKEWVVQWPDKYEVTEISVRGEDWKKADFSLYDSVLHVAGTVHTKENKDNINLFYRVNRDLTIEIANKAKNEGIQQFIFMSTMNVYGVSTGIITKDTLCNPKTAYGKSKLEAENLLLELQDGKFNISIVRPPMVYGPNTVGNYVSLSKLAKVTPIFPNINNQRSMIYIDNLSEFIRLSIEDNIFGIYCPQNTEYVNVSDLVKKISEINKKKIYLSKVFNPIIKMFMNISVSQKVFGNLLYEKKLSLFDEYDYNVVSFDDSVYKSEKLEEIE